MINTYIYWTNVYRLNHVLGAFKIFISSYTDGSFQASILWYTKKGSWSDQEKLVSLKMQLHNIGDVTEEGAMNQCEAWIKNNLPGEYVIEIEERKG